MIDWKQLRPVTKDDHAEIAAWHRARGVSTFVPDLTPPQGFIYPGVAAGFMIRTNTNLAILEGFVSNPEAPKADRGAALAKIAECLIAAAEANGIVGILAITDSPVVEGLCSQFTLKPLDGLKVYARGREWA